METLTIENRKLVRGDVVVRDGVEYPVLTVTGGGLKVHVQLQFLNNGTERMGNDALPVFGSVVVARPRFHSMDDDTLVAWIDAHNVAPDGGLLFDELPDLLCWSFLKEPELDADQQQEDRDTCEGVAGELWDLMVGENS